MTKLSSSILKFWLLLRGVNSFVCFQHVGQLCCLGSSEGQLSSLLLSEERAVACIRPPIHRGRGKESTGGDSMVPNVLYKGVKLRDQNFRQSTRTNVENKQLSQMSNWYCFRNSHRISNVSKLDAQRNLFGKQENKYQPMKLCVGHRAAPGFTALGSCSPSANVSTSWSTSRS